MLLEDSRLGQGCISLHSNTTSSALRKKFRQNVVMILIVVNLLVYFRQVPNSVNVWFLDHSMCTVLKKFNLTLLKVAKYIECFLPSPTVNL